MSQSITLLNASYSDVPAVLLPKTGGGTARFDDTSVTTATASDVSSGKVFIASDGTVTTGTASGSSTTHTATITRNNSETNPRVQVNGTGTIYRADGETFTFVEGDYLYFYLGNSDYDRSVYVNGIRVSGGSNYYTWYPPCYDIGIEFESNANDRIVRITTPTLTITQNGAYDVSSYANADVSIPTGTARTSSDITVSGATVTVPAGLYSAQASKSVASGTEGTPIASKGAVSNHSISVTPSVTNSTGYITGSTKTGTAVTVSASELVSGSETKTANGTYDVTDLAELVVNVPSPSGTTNITANGTYDVTDYASAIVNVSVGASIPKFTVTWEDDWETISSVTCDTSYADCLAWVQGYPDANLAAYVCETDESNTESYTYGATAWERSGYIRYTAIEGGRPVFDIEYASDNTLTSVMPSACALTLNATANGTYNPSGGVYTSAVVNVPEKTLTTKTITANGTYNASGDNADGYSSVTVNVPTGGSGSSYQLIASASYTTSTTSTSAATVATLSTGDSSLWTSGKMVYVRIRDAAGPRDGYFYGSDSFFTNPVPANSGSNTSNQTIHGMIYRCSGSTFGCRYSYGTTGYGVYPDTIYSDGRVRIRKRYNSSYSTTVDGTYNVDVYLLDWPGGVSPFA